jgi:hypothetical protein
VFVHTAAQVGQNVHLVVFLEQNEIDLNDDLIDEMDTFFSSIISDMKRKMSY